MTEVMLAAPALGGGTAPVLLPVIVEAHIIPSDSRVYRYEAVVMVEMSDGTLEDVFRYYDDELSFSAREFVGLTFDDARRLRTMRDIAYLQS